MNNVKLVGFVLGWVATAIDILINLGIVLEMLSYTEYANIGLFFLAFFVFEIVGMILYNKIYGSIIVLVLGFISILFGVSLVSILFIVSGLIGLISSEVKR